MADIPRSSTPYPRSPTPILPPMPKGPPSYKVVTGTEDWDHNVFDCLKGGLFSRDLLCLKSTFCPCFVYGKQQARLRNPSLVGYHPLNTDCFFFAGTTWACGLSWILNFMKRGEIRDKYSIKGNQLDDCLLSACCGCCVLVQQEKEIMGKQSNGVQGYMKPLGMIIWSE